VVMRALEKHPALRYQDADEFINALEDARGAATTAQLGAPVYAAPAGPPTMVEPPSEPYPYPPEPLPPREERDRGRWWWWVLALLLVAGAIVAGVLLLGGGKQVTVPTVVGADQANAEARLRQEGFKTDATPKTSERPKGEVIGQDPSGGSRADKGSTVELTVSDGPAQVGVPQVAGLTLKSAQGRLTKAGLKSSVREESSDTVDKGRVISATPAEGQQVDKGSEVALVVSTGPEQVDVPDETGKSFDEASSELEAAGFKVTRKDQETADEDPGTVLSQSPKGGGQAPKGSAVTLTVAKEPSQIDVPDVTGEDQGDAISRLSSAGFEIRRQEKDVDSPEGDGVVIQQDPPGGKAKKGSTVTIVVGKFNPNLNPEGTPTTPGTTP
jgi:eukaryotic-like serine/threonine-protein kinase